MAKLIEITGKALSGEWGLEDESRTGIPVLRTTNFTNLGIINYGNVVTRNITKKNISEKFLRKGDIIIEKSGGSDKQPVGRVVLFNGEENRFLFNNFTGVLRVKDREKWVPDYVFYALFANYRNGGTRKYENKTTGLHNLKTDLYINNYEIEWINIAEQKNVCATLRKIESIISDMNKEIDYLDELIKARFVEMFGESNCETKKLSEITDIITKGTTPTTAGFEFTNDGVNFFKIESITEDHTINLNKVAHVSDKCHATLKRSQLRAGDVLFSIAGAIGRTAIIGQDDLPGNTNQALAIIRLSDNSGISQKYLISALDSPEIFKQCHAKKRGVAQINLSLQDVGNIEIPIPNLDDQKAFESFTKQVDKSKFAVQKSLEKTQLLFDGLMQEYFG